MAAVRDVLSALRDLARQPAGVVAAEVGATLALGALLAGILVVLPLFGG